jgi:hypothetical protein
LSAGINIAISSAIIAITTNSSTSVNPLRDLTVLELDTGISDKTMAFDVFITAPLRSDNYSGNSM